jgi:hypothetical protein
VAAKYADNNWANPIQRFEVEFATENSYGLIHM